MEKIKINHFYFMEEGKRIEETVEAIDLGNGYALTMTDATEPDHYVMIHTIYEGSYGPEIGWHSEISENVMYSIPKHGRIPSLEEIAAMSAVELMLFLAGKYGKEAA
ncbi:hypothetical protein P4T89_08495 [Bacillus nakamurai]|uniref:Uncharacterized protein n=1 Tax=Bacillus nakamurai TaxID=1793963 RepID=A0A150F630_9BACI|nr:hypothetical protein [Bacillus nakamurai]KXZ17728.1 hypothetical protein AXI58_18485 [Bacillus nakamurai]MED1227629.1 hypothetical protein [Bacillus nakamurai]